MTEQATLDMDRSTVVTSSSAASSSSRGGRMSRCISASKEFVLSVVVLIVLAYIIVTKFLPDNVVSDLVQKLELKFQTYIEAYHSNNSSNNNRTANP